MLMNFFSNREFKRYPIADIDKLSSFSGVIFSSPEVLFVKSRYFYFERSNISGLGREVWDDL